MLIFIFFTAHNKYNPVKTLNVETYNMAFGISFFDTFSAIFQSSRDQPVVTGGGNRSIQRKPPPNPKSLTDSYCYPSFLVTFYPNKFQETSVM